MVKKYVGKLKKASQSSKWHYLSYLDLPIDEKAVLLEGGQGSNINGNMFSMLKEICENPRWAEYIPVFVVTENTLEKAQSRMAFYGYKKVVLTIRDSKEYQKYLATAKYLLTDNTFPPYFNKRDEQIFLNTWHGTPLKTLGKANKESLASLGNVQKNYLMSDYALFPNEFTRNVFMTDYDLAPIFNNKSFIANYPRNYIFYDIKAGEEIKKKLGYEGKTVFAYMPTWRDASTAAQKKKHLQDIVGILNEFDEKLNDNQVLLVNLHFLLSSEIDCDNYKHIEYFSPDYDTYEILNACDGLITDYSSVFFDYAVSGKNIILFAYDKEEYLTGRGIYIDFEKLPFPIVEKVEDVVALYETTTPVPQSFIDEYCTYGDKNSCEKLFELMVTGESDYYNIEKHSSPDNLCVLYGGTMGVKSYYALKAYIDENPGYKYVIAYRKALTQGKKARLDEIIGDISIYGLLTAFQFKKSELLIYLFARVFGVFKSKLDNFFGREKNRYFPFLKPFKVVDFAQNNIVIAGILSKFNCSKEYVTHGNFCGTLTHSGVVSYENKKGFTSFDGAHAENDMILSIEDAEQRAKLVGRFSRARNILPLYFNRGNKMRMVSYYSFKSPVKINTDDLYVTVADHRYTPKFIGKRKASYIHKGIISLTIPVEDMISNPAKSAVSLGFDFMGAPAMRRLKYFAFLRGWLLGLKGPMNIHDETKTVALFRQAQKNMLIVYVRSANYTDKLLERFKQLVAFTLSLLWKTKKAKKLVLLYEKNSSKYEESASVVYEYLLDNGYRNAYFIVDKSYEYLDRIPEKYKKNIIYKYSFKHYLYFFTSKTFIGTEALAHAFDLKTCNQLPLYKISRKNLNYVFLQHGVMYMVSLDSESRKMFKRKNLDGKYRVVVSSEAEKEHFTSLGRHLDEDIYVCGLPKYDRNTLNADADKIIIMPTWRPWEINIARSDFSESPYYKMLMKLYNNVPDELKEKVVILPHPLIVNELTKASPEVTDKLLLDARYDDVLKTAKILITDYSSIAFDSFYRGSNVIFYWEEKDYCMEQYGPTTKLMLNEENVYGDYFYSDEGLTQGILDNYNNPQKEIYKERYSHLVNFHDGKNTQRLVEFLKEDEII